VSAGVLICCHCSLKFGEVLGEGAFGLVMKAEAYGIGGCDSNRIVAVKMLKGDYSQVVCKMNVYCFSTGVFYLPNINVLITISILIIAI